ncbi:MAG TPA: hypothetical protein VLV83_06055 [Acidobacteriota bacterium]|nr:hypothetical protein [Acidobacteriota bacterium]
MNTDKDLGNRAFMQRLLRRWVGEIDEPLRVSHFDDGEPVRRPFAEEGVEAAVELWQQEGRSPFLARRKSPRQMVVIDWRAERGLDKRPFPWSCTVWLSPQAGDTLTKKLFRFLIEEFEPVFGSVTTYEDRLAKHLVEWDDPLGRTSQMMGRDPGETIPGIYWQTYFGPWALEKIGLEKFHEIADAAKEQTGGGLLVQLYEPGRLAGSPEAREREAAVRRALGEENFFDPAQVDIESLKTKPADAAQVESLIGAMKARKGEDQ